MSKSTLATLPADIIYDIVDYSFDKRRPCCEIISSLMLISRHWFDTLRGMDYNTYKYFIFYDEPEGSLGSLETLNRLKRYLSSPYARERPVHKLELEFENDGTYEALRDQLDVILSKNRFNNIEFRISDEADWVDPEDLVPIRLPQSLKAYELSVSGSAEQRSTLDWSSFNPFLKHHLQKLELSDLNHVHNTYENRLYNLQSLSINRSSRSDYSSLVMNHPGIEYLNMHFDWTVACLDEDDEDEDDDDEDEDEDDEDEDDEDDEGDEEYPKLQLRPLNNLKTLICNHELDFSSMECPSLKHIELDNCTFPVSGWDFDADRIETIHLRFCRPTASPSSPIWENSDDFAGVEAIKHFKNLKVLLLFLAEPDDWKDSNSKCKNIDHFIDLFNRGVFDDCWPHLEKFCFFNYAVKEEAINRFFSKHPKLSPESHIRGIHPFNPN